MFLYPLYVCNRSLFPYFGYILGLFPYFIAYILGRVGPANLSLRHYSCITEHINFFAYSVSLDTYFEVDCRLLLNATGLLCSSMLPTAFFYSVLQLFCEHIKEI